MQQITFKQREKRLMPLGLFKINQNYADNSSCLAVIYSPNAD